MHFRQDQDVENEVVCVGRGLSAEFVEDGYPSRRIRWGRR
jgi:hypothetical protein